MHAIKKLMCYGTDKLCFVTKTELRSMSIELTLLFGIDISNVSNAMVNEEGNSIFRMLPLIEKEEEDEDVI